MTRLIEESDVDAVYLRALEANDLDRIWRWHNDERLYATLGGTYRSVSRETVADWLQRKMNASPHEWNQAVCLSASHEHIGNAYLRDIDPAARKAELHLFIGDAAFRGRGYGQAATRWLLSQAFEQLDLQRVYLHVLANNRPAIRAYERCGFEREGVLRRHACKQGQFMDMLVMGCLRPDPAPRTASSS